MYGYIYSSLIKHTSVINIVTISIHLANSESSRSSTSWDSGCEDLHSRLSSIDRLSDLEKEGKPVNQFAASPRKRKRYRAAIQRKIARRKIAVEKVQKKN
eukprot:GHVR01057781.1.p1 GENE.GHVR01057781.1~~GHVR01057781.1.p1  ORF type:complete len:100 (-),score=0.73 GHVR01057781.1:593-892(-)